MLYTTGSLLILTVSLAGDEPLAPWLSAWDLIDLAILYVLAYGVYRHSRVAAVLLLGMFIGSEIRKAFFLGLQLDNLRVVIVSLIYGLGVMGAFRYHSPRRRDI